MAYEYALSKGTILRHKPLIGKESVYFIEDTLGQGGFGITYLASRNIKIGNTPHKILFAIKEFFVKGQCWRENGSSQMKYSPAAKSEVDECRKDFIDEANRLNKICSENANIVNVNEVFEANDTAYYVMEFLSGKSLRDKILKLKGALQEKEALSLIIPIAESIEYIHSEYRLLHCDISPDNIMLRNNSDGSFTPVLIDFGESLHFNSKGELTTTHNAIGAKEGYAPQEQYRGVASFDSRIDVYALGATLFYLLTGKKPISAFDISQDYIDKNLPNNLSGNIREAIRHAMAKDKEDRTKTAKEFVSTLRGGSQEPSHNPKSRTLPIGYNLYSGSSKAYEITTVLERTPFFVRYKAERVSVGTSQHTSNATRRARCDVYEYFDLNNHQRIDNLSLISAGDLSVSQQQFLSFCADKAGNALSVTAWHCDDVRWDAFKLNNTFYLVDTHRRNPLPWRKLLLYPSAIMGLILLLYLIVVNIPRSVLISNDAATMFKEAVEKKDTTALKSLIEDSAYYDAIVPLANIYLENGREDEALEYASKADTTSNMEARTIIKNVVTHKIDELNGQIKQIVDNFSNDATNRIDQLVQAKKLQDSVRTIAEPKVVAYTVNQELMSKINSDFNDWVEAGDNNPIQSVKISCYKTALRLKEDQTVRRKLDELK